MRLLITGADGFIGRVLARGLLEQGHEIIGTVFWSTPGEEQIHLDVTDPRGFARLPRGGVDAVINAVGVVDQRAPSRQVFAVNADGARRLAGWALESGCEHFVQLSSIAVYGVRANGVDRCEATTPRYDGRLAIPYGRSKARAERHLIESGVPYTADALAEHLGGLPTCVTWQQAVREACESFVSR